MDKKDAIGLLGGTVAAAAEAVGISYQAVVNWPDPLPVRISDRVQAVLYRRLATTHTNGSPPDAGNEVA